MRGFFILVSTVTPSDVPRGVFPKMPAVPNRIVLDGYHEQLNGTSGQSDNPKPYII